MNNDLLVHAFADNAALVSSMILPVEKRVFTISGIQTLVTLNGSGRNLLCLHGWGASHESFAELRETMKSDPVRIIAPDLPGFGESGILTRAWSVDDYADHIAELVKILDLTDVFLLGHSHGGRVAIKLASRGYPWISHLYLCAAAGIRRSKHFRRKVGILLASIGKTICSIPGLRTLQPTARKLLYKFLMVHDYERAEGALKETMVRVIDEDMTPLLDRIVVPTDLFWGEDDTMTPLADAIIMNKKIVQSNLLTFAGVRHRVHRDRAGEVAGVIRKAL